jgi:hypothetical protein
MALLDDLDKELEKRGLPFVRYADDFVIFTRSRRAAERVFEGVIRYLTEGSSPGGKPGEEPNRARGWSRVPRLRLLRPEEGSDPRVGEERPEIQTADTQTDRTESRNLDDAAARCTPSIPERLGGLLCVGDAEAIVRIVRQVDSTSSSDVEDTRQRGWNDERLAASKGTGLAAITLGQAQLRFAESRRLDFACYVLWGAGGESRLPTRFGMHRELDSFRVNLEGRLVLHSDDQVLGRIGQIVKKAVHSWVVRIQEADEPDCVPISG